MCTSDLVSLARRLPKRLCPQVPPYNDQPTDAFPKESGGHPTGQVGGDDHDVHSKHRGKVIRTLSHHPFRFSTRRRHDVIHRGRLPSGGCSVSHGSKIHLSFFALYAPYATLRECTDTANGTTVERCETITECIPLPVLRVNHTIQYSVRKCDQRGSTWVVHRTFTIFLSLRASLAYPAYFRTFLYKAFAFRFIPPQHSSFD